MTDFGILVVSPFGLSGCFWVVIPAKLRIVPRDMVNMRRTLPT